ncbi:NmrA family NAD(P)-binding protein [Tolypothrix sp. VBCCA 56010]|uniref:NmrA family NAD(P)-binding protein n=1 Tax=Tolypothrix sp. VBCCA 56010 TaxID=3137731 RepID=UPI003D7DA936
MDSANKYASLVVPELKQRGAIVRALARNETKAEAARQQGADEVAIGDLQDSDSLRAATSEVDDVFHINPAFAPNEAELGVAMVEAAKAAGVQKFVFSGAIHPSISKMSNHAAKRPIEEALYESGMDFTVLQPTMFMQTKDNSTVISQIAVRISKAKTISQIRDIVDEVVTQHPGPF